VNTVNGIDRRSVCAGLGASGLLALGAPALSHREADFRMWHSPGCGCCLSWAKRVESAFGRPLQISETGDMAAVKRSLGVPADLQSCHTARIGGIVVEGHVPPTDIKRLIARGNGQGYGLAVPGMPAGSPGMDVGHDHREPYTVFAFDRQGRRTAFAQHGGAR
jgi:hypothetical protein